MPSGTFVIFLVQRFPEPGGRRKYYKTEDRKPRGSRDERADPVYTSIRLTGEGAPAGFNHAAMTHRKGVRIEGLWHGNVITEVVQQSKFDAYFDLGNRIFIARTEKNIGLSAVKDLNEDEALREFFQLRTVDLDFRQIIPRAINVIGSWFKGMRYTNIRSEAAFGDQINRDAEFTRLSGLGQHSNLLVVLDFNGSAIKVNLSRVGSTYFMEDYPLRTCLEFMVYLLNFQTSQPPAIQPAN